MSRVLGGCRALMAAARANSTAGQAPPPKSTKGFMKPVTVSPAMSKFLGGAPAMCRPEVVKKVWDHIKLHNLQNPANKKEIICDEKLKSIFDGKDNVGMMEIAKLLSPHFLKSN